MKGMKNVFIVMLALCCVILLCGGVWLHEKILRISARNDAQQTSIDEMLPILDGVNARFNEQFVDVNEKNTLTAAKLATFEKDVNEIKTSVVARVAALERDVAEKNASIVTKVMALEKDVDGKNTSVVSSVAAFKRDVDEKDALLATRVSALEKDMKANYSLGATSATKVAALEEDVKTMRDTRVPRIEKELRYASFPFVQHHLDGIFSLPQQYLWRFLTLEVSDFPESLDDALSPAGFVAVRAKVLAHPSVETLIPDAKGVRVGDEVRLLLYAYRGRVFTQESGIMVDDHIMAVPYLDSEVPEAIKTAQVFDSLKSGIGVRKDFYLAQCSVTAPDNDVAPPGIFGSLHPEGN